MKVGLLVRLDKAWCVGLLLVLGACASSGPPILSAGDRYSAVAETSESYRLGSEDKIRISIYNEPQLTGDYLVSSDGKISLPLIGDVDVGGKTMAEAAAGIEQALSHGFLHNPRVSMVIDAP